MKNQKWMNFILSVALLFTAGQMFAGTESQISEEQASTSETESQAFGSSPYSQEDGWSAPIYHPEVYDRVIEVNGEDVDDEIDFRYAIKNSPRRIYMTLIDHRTGSTYRLRTWLLPSGHPYRLGLYFRTSSNGGVRIVGHMPGYPCMRCQIPLN